jgi:transposase InsO family protein
MDNGKEFTDRLFGLRERAGSEKHALDKLCTALDIEHRLTPPGSPQTNGPPVGDCGQSPAGQQRVERFNGRLEDVLQSHHVQSGEKMEATPHRDVRLYNQQRPQSTLGSKTPLQVIKDWHKLTLGLFKRQPYYRPGCDTYISKR